MLQFLGHFHEISNHCCSNEEIIWLYYPLPAPIHIMKAIIPIASTAPFLLIPIDLVSKFTIIKKISVIYIMIINHVCSRISHIQILFAGIPSSLT